MGRYERVREMAEVGQPEWKQAGYASQDDYRKAEEGATLVRWWAYIFGALGLICLVARIIEHWRT